MLELADELLLFCLTSCCLSLTLRFFEQYGFEGKAIPIKHLLDYIADNKPELLEYAFQKITHNRPFVPPEEVIGHGIRRPLPHVRTGNFLKLT